jgi:murein DD-endopeptidase MepM/ murein hydrolase activator NlpD
MNLKWTKKKLTLVVIPVGLILVSSTMFYLHIHTRSADSELKNQLAAADSEWRQTISSKEQAIQQLQTEVIQRSKQGEGGQMIPVTQEEILKLGNQTAADMNLLDQEIDELHSTLKQTKQKVEEKQSLLRSTPTIWPTTSQQITSSYGYRRDPFTHAPSFHDGIDIGAAENEPVYAAADGKVTATGYDHARGNNIVINHGNGLSTWYMHLNKIVVTEGDSVTKGQSIGLLGSTGRSTGPHLHYQILKNGETLDPKPFLQTTRKDDK